MVEIFVPKGTTLDKVRLKIVACIEKYYYNEETGGIAVKNTMEYKGYVGSVEFSEEDGLFFGQVLGIRSLISYEGSTAAELLQDFHGAIDDYLATCAAEGVAPEKAYKGSFNVRIPAEMHKQAAVYALEHNMSLNSFVERAVQKLLEFEDYHWRPTV